jgi:hypothetical protein
MAKLKPLLNFAYGGLTALLALTPAAAFDLPKTSYPTLVKRAPAPEGFVPPGWALESSATGDLNADGRPDKALVLRQTDPKNIIENKGLGVDKLNTNPRVLVLLFADAAGAGYTLAAEERALIPRHESPTADDPLEKVFISKGNLYVQVKFWASAGSWSMSNAAFTLRYQDSCFRMIGYDSQYRHRGNGQNETRSVNYFTGKMSRITVGGENDAQKTLWSTLKSSRKICLGDIGDGLAFDPVTADRP